MRYGLLCLVLTALAAPAVRADDYADDFSTEKARYDCYQASIFWPGDIDNPPPRPYLSYLETEDAGGLIFMNCGDDLAHLAYSFRLGAGQPGPLVRGTLRLEVAFPCNAQVSQFRPGQLLYSISLNGLTWSAPLSLSAGAHEIPLQSATGSYYVLLSGARAVMESLRIAVPGVAVRVQDNPGPTQTIYHVDAETGSDTSRGTSRARAFATVTKAIESARNGDAVVVWPGTYREEITFRGKAIAVQSAADAAVLTAPGSYAVSFYGAESSKSVLANFVITGCGVGAVFCDGASPTLRNLTITKNQAAVVAYGGANPYIVNCILWDNAVTMAAWKANFRWEMYYSCTDQISPDKTRGNINALPGFADSANGDFHLRSRSGRYVALTDTWVFDLTTSPCIDTGHPADGPRAELTSSRIDMGAYGGTPFASKSSEPRCP